ncbi:MAG: hypothetical protein KF760_06100 [Candidatus Eremiobacteraeota bacterium]|nr:hypothetical protein [Candidatus Eremiobacteraeota bacterium]MCW5869992.1 hypothetical protein [Candidatus Eremiobacteraeota bacterium]
MDLDWQGMNPHFDLDLEIWCHGWLELQAGDNLVEFRFSRWGINGARDQWPLALRLRICV